MTTEEVYLIWAPPGFVWSQWVSSIPFAELYYSPAVEELEPLCVKAPPQRCAVVVDLAGERSVRLAIQLAASRGLRPVPVIRAWPGEIPSSYSWDASVVQMRELFEALCAATPHLLSLSLEPDAPPVFILDGGRLPYTTGSAAANMFDNRWRICPQDLPSAEFLKHQGIEDVIWVDEERVPREDLAHVLLRWQEADITIVDFHGDPVDIPRPPRYRAPWQRVVDLFGLQRNPGGGFGGKLPGPER